VGQQKNPTIRKKKKNKREQFTKKKKKKKQKQSPLEANGTGRVLKGQIIRA